MAIRVRPKQVGLKLRSGDFIKPGEEASIPADEAWHLYIRGLVDIVVEGEKGAVEYAVAPPPERRSDRE